MGLTSTATAAAKTTATIVESNFEGDESSFIGKTLCKPPLYQMVASNAKLYSINRNHLVACLGFRNELLHNKLTR